MFDPFLTEKQILRKLGGDKTPGKVLTYDGNKEGKEVFVDEFVKVSGIAENANAVVHISVLNHGEVEELEKGALSVIAQSDTVNMIFKAGEDNPLLVFVSAETNFGEMDGVTLVLPIGTYIVDYGDTYATRIEFAETIVPIDQKHLGGVCLPVVELETAITSTQVALSEEDGAQMDTLNGEPAVLKLVAIVNGAEWALRGIAACTNVDGMLVYSITSYFEDTLLVLLVNAGNGWLAACNYG